MLLIQHIRSGNLGFVHYEHHSEVWRIGARKYADIFDREAAKAWIAKQLHPTSWILVAATDAEMRGLI